MNEIFELRRFWALAVKFYRENMKINLIFIAAMVGATFALVCKGNPFLVEYFVVPTEGEMLNFLAEKTTMYTRVFWSLLAVFSIIVAVSSFKNVTSRQKVVGVLLLPASSFEKYLLVFLHSTVVILLVHLVVFYATTSFTNSYKYVGIKIPHFTEGGLFGNQLPYPVPGQEVVRPEVGNVFRLMKDKISYKTTFSKQNGEVVYSQPHRIFSPFLAWNLIIIGWMFTISMFMWGSITFRKGSALLTILSHGLLVFSLAWIFWVFTEVIDSERVCSDLYNLRIRVLQPGDFKLTDLSWWFLLFYIFPVTYFAIIWRKFKDKQV